MNRYIVALLAAVVMVAAWNVVEPPRAASTTAAESPKVVEVAVSIGGERRVASVPEGSTVLRAMESLSAAGEIAVAYEEHPSLGKYVASIGGRAAAGGYYWTLYVNGRESDAGASTKTVAEGDVIEWRYEKR